MDMIKVLDAEVNRLEYKGEAIVTLRMVDELHQRPEGTARRNFNQNKTRFISGEDYFSLPYEEWQFLGVGERTNFARSEGGSVSSEEGENGDLGGGYKGNMTFLTESGYLMVTKSFTDDRSWEVQRTLVKCYFAVKRGELAATVPATRLMELLERHLTLTEKHIALLENQIIKRTHKPPITPDEVDRMYELEKEGVIRVEIARALGRSKGIVTLVLDGKHPLSHKPETRP